MSDSVQFEVENVGPIERKIVKFRFGMNVIKGRNGRGKSTMLNACEAYASGKPKGLTVSDGATVGRISGPGREIALRRRSTTIGEAELELVGNQNLASAFVNGGNFKDMAVRDNARMAACLQMFEIPTDETVFVSLVGGQEVFESLAAPQTRACQDIVEFAERFRRDLQATARRAEAEAEREQQKALALRDSCRDIDLEKPSDGPELSQGVQRAMTAVATAKAAKVRYEEAKGTRAEAETKLAEMADSRPNMQELHAFAQIRLHELNNCSADLCSLQEQKAELERKIADCQRRGDAASIKLRSAQDQIAAAEVFEANVNKLADLLNKPLPPEVTTEQVAIAEHEVKVTQDRQEYGVLGRRAVEQLHEAKQHADKAVAATRDAERYRGWADAIDEVLTQALASCGIPITWNQGRMITQTKRGVTFVDELGEGERWCIVAIHLAKFKPGSFFIVPQECWEALDPQNREMIHVCCVQHKIVGVTGLADEHEELVCEEFVPTLVA